MRQLQHGHWDAGRKKKSIHMAGRPHGSQERARLTADDERDSYKLYVVDLEDHQAQPISHSAWRQVVDFVSSGASDFIIHDVHASDFIIHYSCLNRFTWTRSRKRLHPSLSRTPPTPQQTTQKLEIRRTVKYRRRYQLRHLRRQGSRRCQCRRRCTHC